MLSASSPKKYTVGLYEANLVNWFQLLFKITSRVNSTTSLFSKVLFIKTVVLVKVDIKDLLLDILIMLQIFLALLYPELMGNTA